MNFGICGLCKNSADLHDSHLLPSALYKFMREPSLKNPNPVVVALGRAVPSSDEVRRHFLCAVCEDRFNKNGEKWILRYCAQPDGSFPLYDNLTARSAMEPLGQVALYASAGAVGIEPEQIAYFACSVFWRSAATEWRNHPIRLDMGSYEERFRRYLLGEEPFPYNAALKVILASPKASKLLALFPLADSINGMLSFTFLIPGMMFTLILSQHIPEGLKRVVLSPSLDRVIGVSDEMYRQCIQAIASNVQLADPKGYLKEFWNGPDLRRKGK